MPNQDQILLLFKQTAYRAARFLVDLSGTRAHFEGSGEKMSAK
jgi:hypothetical protein